MHTSNFILKKATRNQQIKKELSKHAQLMHALNPRQIFDKFNLQTNFLELIKGERQVVCRLNPLSQSPEIE